jgi:hypothetical protein
MPAKAGIHASKKQRSRKHLPWVPAFAGTTAYGLARHREQVIARTSTPLTEKHPNRQRNKEKILGAISLPA